MQTAAIPKLVYRIRTLYYGFTSYCHKLSVWYGNSGSNLCNTAGWDTDQFPMDVAEATLVMLSVIKNVCLKMCCLYSSGFRGGKINGALLMNDVVFVVLQPQGGLAPGGFNFDAKL